MTFRQTLQKLYKKNGHFNDDYDILTEKCKTQKKREFKDDYDFYAFYDLS